MSNALDLITADIYGVRDDFERVLCDKSISFEREAGFAIQVISASDYAMKLARNNRQSVVDAVTNVAAIGISLNPARKQAYLVPRDGKICLDISYIGMLDLAVQTGSIRWGHAELVYSGDKFKRQGFDKPPIHEYEEFSTSRGDLVGVYVVVKTIDGDYLTTTMTIADVHAIRGRSKAWQKYVSEKKSCPWVTDPGEMTKKTVIKRAYKTWPKNDRLSKAIHYLNTDGDEGLADVQQPGVQMPAANAEFDLQGWLARVRATTDDAAALALYKEGAKQLDAQRDMATAKAFKAAVIEHRQKLQQRAAARADATDTDFIDMPRAA